MVSDCDEEGKEVVKRELGSGRTIRLLMALTKAVPTNPASGINACIPLPSLAMSMRV